MKRQLSVLILAITLAGCASTQIPSYLPDKNPISKRYYAEFDQAMAAVKQTLSDFGWEVENSADPAIYEESRSILPGEKQVMIFTKVRQTMAFLGTRYARINVFITTQKGISEIEFRYLTMTSTPVKTFQNYRNNAAVNRMLKHLSGLLQAE